MLDKTYKVKRTKAQQLVLGFETDLGGLAGLMVVLSDYKSAGVAGLYEERVMGWLLNKMRFQKSVLMRKQKDIYGFLEGYESFTFVYWNDVKDCLVVRRPLEVNSTTPSTPSVFKVRRYTRNSPSIDLSKSTLLTLDSNEVRVLKDALSYGSLREDFKVKINHRLHLVDLINDLSEVYQTLEGMSLADIFEVDLSLGITEGLSKGLNRVFVEDLAREGQLESSNKEGDALHIEKTPEGILEIEGFKLVGFYSFFK